VCFDDRPVFTVDWGDDSLIGFNEPLYGWNIQCSQPYILEIEMKTENMKDMVKQILEDWKNYQRVHNYELLSDNCRAFCYYAIDAASHHHQLNPEGKASAKAMLATTILADNIYIAGFLAFVL